MFFFFHSLSLNFTIFNLWHIYSRDTCTFLTFRTSLLLLLTCVFIKIFNCIPSENFALFILHFLQTNIVRFARYHIVNTNKLQTFRKLCQAIEISLPVQVHNLLILPHIRVLQRTNVVFSTSSKEFQLNMSSRC